MIKFKSIVIVTIIAIIVAIIYEFIILYMIKPPKERIVSTFNKNLEYFIEVTDYISKAEGNFNLNHNIFGTTIDGANTNINPEVKRKINVIIRKLKFVGIQEFGENEIYFRRNSGGYEQGIVYLGNDIVPDYIRYAEKIKDHWYYYWTTHV